MAATAVVPAIADAANLDQELLDLLPTLLKLAGERSHFVEKCDQTLDRLEYPAYPEAVLWQKRDFPSIWVDEARLDSAEVDGVRCYLYVTDGVPDQLRAMLAHWEATPSLNRNFSEWSFLRVNGIIEAVDAWAIRLKAAEIPASTAQGLVVKVYALLVASFHEADLIERNRLAQLLATSQREPSDTEEMLVLSSQVAAAKIAMGIAGIEVKEWNLIEKDVRARLTAHEPIQGNR